MSDESADTSLALIGVFVLVDPPKTAEAERDNVGHAQIRHIEGIDVPNRPLVNGNNDIPAASCRTST